MSDKKLTPIQTAIEHYNRRTGNPTADFIYGSIVDYLKSLLPTEKEFARVIFDESREENIYPDSSCGRGIGGQTITSRPKHNDFISFYKQYEPGVIITDQERKD